MKIIAKIHTDFPEKFGIPRQSGISDALKGCIVMEPEFRNPEGFRGLEGYSHLWLLWRFSANRGEHWSATVKPPRLGGKTRMGVFATRSPHRPNGIGLSCVRLERIERESEQGPRLWVSGVDMLDQTPILDIKPYLPYTDAHPEASSGFAGNVEDYHLQVDFPKELLEKFPPEKRKGILTVLAQDPRPGYEHQSEEPYGVAFAGWNVRFTVKDGVLKVFETERLK